MGYAFRRGLGHLLASGRVGEAEGIVVEFGYQLERRRFEDGDAAGPDLENWYRELAAGAEASGGFVSRSWEIFVRERIHLLRRGNADWPAHRTLLQLAVEHADESPITRSAEQWLQEGGCDWSWLRRAERPVRSVPSPCVRIFSGHGERVSGLELLPGNRFVSWSGGSELVTWDVRTGAALRTLAGHEGPVEAALALPDGRVLSWSVDHTLRLWDSETGTALVVLTGHSWRSP